MIPYYPISDAIMRQITELKLSKIKRRIEENHRAEFVYDNALVNAVASRCTEVDSGARNVDHILTGTLLPFTKIFRSTISCCTRARLVSVTCETTN